MTYRAPVLAFLFLFGCGASDPVPDAGGLDAQPPAPSGCVADADCDDSLYCNGEERCMPASDVANRFGCVAGEPPCGARACEEEAETCEEECEDADADGHPSMACGGDDCDDTDPNRFPGNAEVCDDADVDEDCNPETFGNRDADRDRFFDSACCNDERGVQTCGLDCDDAVQGVNPVVPEVCNGFDDNCDGVVDEGCGCTTPGATRACGMDGPGRCRSGTESCESGLWTTCTGVLAAEEEYLCDGTDENCDGETDEGLTIVCQTDGDGDGHPDPAGDTQTLCPNLVALAAPRLGCPPGFTRADRAADCCDSDARVYPQTFDGATWFGAPHACGDYDYDCDGSEAARITQTDRNPSCESRLGRCQCTAGCGRGWISDAPACGQTGRVCEGCDAPDGACGALCEDGVLQECR